MHAEWDRYRETGSSPCFHQRKTQWKACALAALFLRHFRVDSNYNLDEKSELRAAVPERDMLAWPGSVFEIAIDGCVEIGPRRNLQMTLEHQAIGCVNLSFSGKEYVLA
jgi:hypothetical protein